MHDNNFSTAKTLYAVLKVRHNAAHRMQICLHRHRSRLHLHRSHGWFTRVIHIAGEISHISRENQFTRYVQLEINKKSDIDFGLIVVRKVFSCARQLFLYCSWRLFLHFDMLQFLVILVAHSKNFVHLYMHRLELSM